MRRVLSRDDRDRPAAAVLKQKAKRLVNSRIEKMYKYKEEV